MVEMKDNTTIYEELKKEIKTQILNLDIDRLEDNAYLNKAVENISDSIIETFLDLITVLVEQEQMGIEETDISDIKLQKRKNIFQNKRKKEEKRIL